MKKVLTDSLNVIKEKWDYLIVLDACRYDYFKKMNHIKGRLFKKISRGPCTKTWLHENFKGYYKDIIYISANPYISSFEYRGFNGSKYFFKVDCVWEYGWDKETETVHPNEVVKAALRNIDKYPNKKFIIHFLQPHAPYIGQTKITRKKSVKNKKNIKKEQGIFEIEKLVSSGVITIEKFKKAYEDNLELVLTEVKVLLKYLKGRVIVTSDHGESFGKWFIFHHPEGVYTKELLEIPWLEVNLFPASM